MRALFTGCAVVACLGPSGGVAVAQAPAEDSVTGAAALMCNAHSGPSGENPKGFIELTVSPFTRASVTCLTVRGNRATIGVDIFGSRQYLFVEDNRGAGSDRATPFGIPAGDPSTCPTDPPPGSTAELQPVNGDIVVVDSGRNRIVNPCVQERGRVRFTNPQCKRTIP